MRPNRRFAAIFITAIISTISAVSSAEVHKWVDENGLTHYSEFAPPVQERQVEKVKIDKTPESASENYNKLIEKTSKQTELEEEEKRLSKMDEFEQKEYKILKKNCQLAKQNINALKDKSNRKFKDSEGNITFYDDKTRQEKVKKAQDYLDKNCKDVK